MVPATVHTRHDIEAVVTEVVASDLRLDMDSRGLEVVDVVVQEAVGGDLLLCAYTATTVSVSPAERAFM